MDQLYDEEADVLYIDFVKPSHTSDSKLIEDDIILRFDDNNHLIGMTILHAKSRNSS